MARMTDRHAEFDQPLEEGLRSLGLEIEEAQLLRLRAHFTAMVAANRNFNLTRITDPREAALKHYVDSLSLLAWAKARKEDPVSLLDIGTGAGFPSLPIAVMQPAWSITAIDGTRKKTDFVAQVKDDLALQNLSIHHAHTDHWATRSTFDMVTFRAAGKLGPMLTAAHRFVASGGWIVAYKNAGLDHSEQEEAAKALASLGLRTKSLFHYQLDVGTDQAMHRALHLFRP